MRLLICLLVILVFFAACGNPEIPPDVIAKAKMETIIWQLMQSDEYVNSIVIRDTSKKSSAERMKIYQQVFELNKTTLTDFKKSFQFYLKHPDITKVMFDSINARAGRQKTDAFNTRPDSLTAKERMERLQIEKRKSDSIAKASLAKQEKMKKDSTAAKRKRTVPVHKLKADTGSKPLKKQ